MSLISSICCVNCSQIYDDSRKPCLGTCQDSVCQPCRNQMKVFTCPTCGKKDAFKEETINYHGMPIQQSILDQLTEDTIEEFIENQIDKNSGPCQECGDLAKKLRICLDCAKEREIIVRYGSFVNLNQDGLTFIGAFYKAKQFSICANCATDGEHAEHETGLLADVYDEKEVDFEMNLSLRRILDMKFEREMEKNKRNCRFWLYYYKRVAVRIEGERMRARDEIFELFTIQEELREVVEKDLLYRRRIQMIHAENIQRRLEDSEDEEFKEEMRKVAGKILKEEEKLEGEELEQVNQLVKDRILKHCEAENFGETGVDDCKTSLQNLMKARIFMLERLDEYAKAGDLYWQEVEDNQELCNQICPELFGVTGEDNIMVSLATEENRDEAIQAFVDAQVAYYKEYAEQTLCVLTILETNNLFEGTCNFKLTHPNLFQYLCLVHLQEKCSPITNDVATGNVLHFL